MSFEKGDSVVLQDEHSEYDGQVGQVTQVMETMFGDENYTVSFEDGQEAGIPLENLATPDESGAEAEAGTGAEGGDSAEGE